MVLSNAERQKRYREKLRSAAFDGVTAEDVRRVGRIIVAKIAEDDASFGGWDEFLVSSKTRRNRTNWRDLFDTNPANIDDGDFGDDTDLVRRVLVTARAIFEPPAE